MNNKLTCTVGVDDIVIHEITYWLQIGYSCRQDSIASATITSLGALFLQEFFLSDFLMRTKGKSKYREGTLLLDSVT